MQIAIMNLAHNSFIVKNNFRIDGVNLVSKFCHQYEEKTVPIDGSYSGEFRRSGGYAGIAQAGTDLTQ